MSAPAASGQQRHLMRPLYCRARDAGGDSVRGAASGVRACSIMRTKKDQSSTKVLLQRTTGSAMRLPLTIWKRIAAELMGEMCFAAVRPKTEQEPCRLTTTGGRGS
jgi:hypothetical protein